MNQDKIKEIKQKYPKGTRIMLNSMDDPHHPVPSGTLGTVETVDDIGTIHMKWDNGQSLGLIVGEDSFYVIESVQNQEKIREADEKIRVLVVEPMKEPKVEYIENTLDDMQRVVGGLIEEIDLNDNTVLVCNEEGKLMNLQANRRVGRDVIAGTFFIAGDDGSEDLVSLTDEQVNEYKERFHELEEIEQQEVFEKIEITIRGGLKMAKQKEIKIKYPEARVRAINSNLAKKNTTIEVEIMESLNQIYKKHVKPEVREFIEELEGDEPVVSKKPRTIIEEHP
ncbi:DUF3846 domain-containing protein [Faecalibacillus intestinalis]|uniref:DUF3846 domain-containing protein n=1 Tax=Faecalibacillus intestinalis TaxID=1982626 RepID=UPI002FD95479